MSPSSPTDKALILGGYGNFGKRAGALMKAGVPVIIAGRQRVKAEALAAALKRAHPQMEVHAAWFDAEAGLDDYLTTAEGVRIVINTVGPFQAKDYSIARTCIASGIHYIDLADGRDFATGVTALDAEAKQAGDAVSQAQGEC